MFKNTITYCTRCRSMLFWDDNSRPSILKLGNERLQACLNSGCNLLLTGVPEEHFSTGQLDLFRLALLQSGVFEEDADSAVEILSAGHEALAA
jgi:hypothetical protein